MTNQVFLEKVIPLMIVVLAANFIRELHAQEENQEKMREKEAEIGEIPFNRPYKEIVSKLLKLPLNERGEKYKKLSEELAFCDIPKFNRGFSQLIEEIVVQRDFSGLEFLERKLEDARKKYILYFRTSCFLRSKGYEESVRKVLTKWAIANPSNVFLMRYHPDAYKLLIQKLEDKNADPSDRADCASFLADLGYKKALPILEKYEHDRTKIRVIGQIQMKEREYDCLGDICRRCIFTLRQKSVDVILKYLRSGDPEAIEDTIYWMVRFFLHEKSQEEKAEVKKEVKDLLLSYNPKILRAAIIASVEYLPDIVKSPEGLKRVKRAIEKYNKIQEELKEEEIKENERERVILEKTDGRYSIYIEYLDE